MHHLIMTITDIRIEEFMYEKLEKRLRQRATPMTELASTLKGNPNSLSKILRSCEIIVKYAGKTESDVLCP